MNIGDAVFMFGLWVWLMWRVGPWWFGVVIFVVGFVANVALRLWVRRRVRNDPGAQFLAKVMGTKL